MNRKSNHKFVIFFIKKNKFYNSLCIYVLIKLSSHYRIKITCRVYVLLLKFFML